MVKQALLYQHFLIQRILLALVILKRINELLSLAGDLSAIAQAGGGGEGASSTSTFAFTFDSSNRRTKLTYPNGVTTIYSYDTGGRLTNLLTQYAELKEQGKKKPPILKLHTLDSFTYTHDRVGNRLGKTEFSSPSPLAGEGWGRQSHFAIFFTMPLLYSVQ